MGAIQTMHSELQIPSWLRMHYAAPSYLINTCSPLATFYGTCSVASASSGHLLTPSTSIVTVVLTMHALLLGTLLMLV